MKKHTLGLAFGAFVMLGAGSGGVALAKGHHIDGKNYKVDADAAACKAGKECTATIKLEVGGGYHLNKEYPYKLKVAETAGVKYAKAEFGRPSGDFVEASEHSGTITIKYTPEKAGKTEIGGVYKFAVCSDKECSTATETIKIPVDVK